MYKLLLIGWLNVLKIICGVILVKWPLYFKKIVNIITCIRNLFN